jgi:light-regulated signal transduction histidine kinase (bacteriophytochrome)
MHQERLWGLVTCNHESGERFIPYETRTACALIGEVASVLIAQRVSAGAAAERGAFLDIQAKLVQLVVHDRDVVGGLTQQKSLLPSLTDATGAALYYQKTVHTVGKTPSQEALAGLVAWIEAQGCSSLVIDSLPARFAPAHGYKDVACGLLAIAIDVEGSTVVEHRSWLLWFRPEVIQTIKWGADPNKPVTASSTGELHPRISFERWREEVSLQCVPWRETDRAAAQSLAAALVDVILEIEASRLFKENALVLAAANRNLHHQMEANARVEQVLAARTEQHLQSEASLRVVLGASDDGLVGVGLDGRMQPDCSPAVEAWFGKLSGKTFVWDLLFAGDPAGAREFEVLFRQLASDASPFDAAARPMCREITRGDRRLELGFKPVRQGRSLVSILVTIKDLTKR